MSRLSDLSAYQDEALEVRLGIFDEMFVQPFRELNEYDPAKSSAFTQLQAAQGYLGLTDAQVRQFDTVKRIKQNPLMAQAEAIAERHRNGDESNGGGRRKRPEAV